MLAHALQSHFMIHYNVTARTLLAIMCYFQRGLIFVFYNCQDSSDTCVSTLSVRHLRLALEKLLLSSTRLLSETSAAPGTRVDCAVTLDSCSVVENVLVLPSLESRCWCRLNMKATQKPERNATISLRYFGLCSLALQFFDLAGTAMVEVWFVVFCVSCRWGGPFTPGISSSGSART